MPDRPDAEVAAKTTVGGGASAEHEAARLVRVNADALSDARAVIPTLGAAAFAMQTAAWLGRDPPPELIERARRRHHTRGADGPT